MTREEAIAIIRKEYLCVDRDCDIERSCGKCDLVMPDKEPILEAYKMAIKALEQEPCEDAVSRQAAKRALEDRYIELQKRHDDKRLETNYCLNTILELPPVTRLPKTGHWEQYGNSWEDKFKCSECGKEQPKILCGERIIGHWSDYCPNCGAKMGGAE